MFKIDEPESPNGGACLTKGLQPRGPIPACARPRLGTKVASPAQRRAIRVPHTHPQAARSRRLERRHSAEHATHESA